jgi:ATP-binding cassette subfamily C (CFTR/MRP) protein 1
LKAVILVFEAWEKTPYLASRPEDRSPEVTSGIFNRSVFYWLNKILVLGYQRVFSLKDLYPLDEHTEAAVLHANIEKSWAEMGDGWGQHRMLSAIFKSHWPPLLLPIIPRLCLIGFTFCQPLLLNRTLDFLGQREQSDTPDIGNGLIGAYAIVYLGLAVSTGFYWHKQLRCLTIIRGSIVTAIYQKTLEVSDGAASITLMSTDVERITTGMRYIHELWSNIVEVGIGTWLLERELGVPCVAPVIVAAGKLLNCLKIQA